MSDTSEFIIEKGVLTKYKGRSSNVVIPEGVTVIGSKAFSNCARVLQLTIPGTVQRIESEAFLGCTSLAKLTIPEGVKEIGMKAFCGCKCLTTLTLPTSLEKIDAMAFHLCDSLTEVIIHDLAAWCRVSFDYFYDKSNPLSLAGKLYLDDELITDLVIPEGVTQIKKFAFCGCTCFKSVTIPASVKSIDDAAFKRCGNMDSGTQNLIWRDELHNCGRLETVRIRSLEAWLNVRFGGGNSNPLINGCKLYLEDEPVTELKIPEGVSKIPYRAFIGCSSLTGVTVPEGITEIGEDAFRSCKSLTHVVIPETVTTIGGGAFAWCKNLKNITIPESVQEIGDAAFMGSGLKSVKIPEGVTSIGKRAFSGCSSLISVTIPESVKSIGDDAFTGSGLKSVTIPEGVTMIGGEAFRGCKRLTSVTIPKTVESIGQRAFWDCVGVSSIVIPQSVTEIGEYAFDEKIHILVTDFDLVPSSLRLNAVLGFAEAGAGKETPGFDGCSKYIKANAAELVETAMAEPMLLSLMCREKLITPKYVELYVKAAQKKGSAETIAMMLDYQANKVSVKKKESVEKRRQKEQDTIAERMMARAGKEGIEGLNIAVSGNLETFDNREKLKAFLHEKGAELASSLTSKVDYLILNDQESDAAKAKKAQELGIEIIHERRFNEMVGRVFEIDGTKLCRYCGMGTEVVIPDGVTEIGDYAFYKYRGLASVNIPNAVTEIGWSAFSGCINLTSVTIPDNVTSIGNSAFSFCSSLTSITLPRSLTHIGNRAFEFCQALTHLTIPEGVICIRDSAFAVCSSLTSVAIPKSVTTIEEEAFLFCNSLKEVHIDDLGAWCGISFAEPSASPLLSGAMLYLKGKLLEQASIPEEVTEIPNWAFANCQSIRSVTIPARVRKIGLEAFRNCGALASLMLPTSVKEIGPRAFSDCAALANENGLVIVKDVLYNYFGKGGEVLIPEGVKRIENSAFNNCKKVTGVALPSSLREIGNEAFSCSGLKSITIPEGVREVGIKAFDWCVYMKDARLPQSLKTIKTDAFSTATIHAPAGSYAEQYAKAHRLSFVEE